MVCKIVISVLAALAALTAAGARYVNPIIDADYSDPDVIRVGDDYWMVASSFNCVPGIPVLHSRDLVNWEIAGHVYGRLPLAKYDRPAHGEGSWAPSIRWHGGLFYVYFCTPEDGLFVARAKDPRGPWDLTRMVDVVKWEDPCPLWDDDGSAYLAHSIHRGGPVVIHRMSADGLRLLDDGTVVYHDEEANPILEGIKMYRRDGWYHILAPAGGVEAGWQTALRSRNIWGPYECRRILEQGPTEVNGPHQGGLVEATDGRWWFVHFQSKGILGRVVHLQPARWGEDGWPETGIDLDGNGIGNPVPCGDTGLAEAPCGIAAGDEFDGLPGLQWQWQANPDTAWYDTAHRPGWLRLNTVPCPSEHGNLWYAPNLLLQKITGPEYTATALVEPHHAAEGDTSGLVVMGKQYSYIAVVRGPEGIDSLVVAKGEYSKFATRPQMLASAPLDTDRVQLRVQLVGDDECRYSYSTDGGATFTGLGPCCKVDGGMWTGAKAGLFSITPSLLPTPGYTLVDWYHTTDRR